MRFFSICFVFYIMFSSICSSVLASNNPTYTIYNDTHLQYDKKLIYRFLNDNFQNNLDNSKLNSLFENSRILEEKITGIEKTIGSQLNIITFFAGSVIAISAAILGMGVYKLHLDSKFLKEEAQKKIEKELNNEIEKSRARIDNFSYFINLKNYLKNDALQEYEVYSLLTPLTVAPVETYRPTFHKILKMNISEDVSLKAHEGLRLLDEKKRRGTS